MNNLTIMKKLIAKMLMLIVALSVSLSASGYDFEADGIYYNITSMADLEVEVTYKQLVGSKNSTYSGNITIPTSVNYNNRTFSVIGIGESAFGSLPSTSSNPKGCDIQSISLPETIRYISKNAFYACGSLSEIRLPKAITYVGNYAFGRTPLSTISLIGVEEIGEYAFYECLQLKAVILGKNLKSIGRYAFSYCSSLLEVFYTGTNSPEESYTIYTNTPDYLEKYVPSNSVYGFGREYLTFPISSFDYTGQSHTIEWTNNLKAYKCEIAESECQTDINAGQYTKYLKATYSNGIDLSVDIPYEYIINKAPMTLTVNDVVREYGDPNPAFTCNISGFVNGENEQTIGTTPTFECAANQMSKVGEYRIVASFKAPNYDITYKYGKLSVLKAPVMATVIDASKIYGNENPDFTLSFSGLKNNETTPEWSVKPKFSTTATIYSGVGQYAVTASDGTAPNYEITKYNPGTLTVSKRDLTAKANDCERLYDEENPKFEISYIGFVNGDSETDLLQQPIAECSATKSSNAGTYPIVVTGGEAENYRLLYQDGVLKINPLTVGFKDVYNSVTYNDMSISTYDSYFNYIPEIVGPFSEDDFWVELWFLDKDNTSSQHVATITDGDYSGNYVDTNLERPMWAGKYIFNLTSKGTNPNVAANPSRAYLTVNRASNNLEWNAESTIYVKVGEKVDLGISYQADLWCIFNTDYNEDLIELSAEGKNGNNPHWYATGLKEGETRLYFGIECKKNDIGFYDFTDSRTLSRLIKVEPSSGIEDVVSDNNLISLRVQDGSIYILNNTRDSVVRVFTLQGALVKETKDSLIEGLNNGVYIITVDNRSFKVII